MYPHDDLHRSVNVEVVRFPVELYRIVELGEELTLSIPNGHCVLFQNGHSSGLEANRAIDGDVKQLRQRRPRLRLPVETERKLLALQGVANTQRPPVRLEPDSAVDRVVSHGLLIIRQQL
ncbi:hypothetical protein [Halorubrum sp. LN27]|uniref:hypothetical protein n=1 Tax=Halorubrum sp. LN27 TaxID=2801032 RepID=UPI002AA2AD20|nr:hypothetical protein [Halorubrum sp. LN27]